MRAVEITSYGAPDVLRLVERPVPEAGEGELRIRVAASGVNRPDVLQGMGHYPVPPGASDIPGLEVAGVIESGDANAAGAAVHQQGFTLLQTPTVEHIAPDSEEGLRQCRSFFV